MEINKVYQGDCMEIMKDFPDEIFDMILCDLPYGMTSCSWDSVLPLKKLWQHYERIAKKDCAIVLTSSQPFTSVLVMSKPEWFKHEWIWEKQKASNFMSFKFQPAKYHENIIVFCKGKINYNPIMWQVSEDMRDKRKNVRNPITNKESHLGKIIRFRKADNGLRFPKSILKIDKSINYNLHPTEKPINLFKYLIRTYTNEGDLVLDNCAGSGTTGLACQRANRNYILIEKESEYIALINKRLSQQNIHHFSNTLTSAEVNPAMQESLISVKKESADSQNSPHIDNTNKEEANFS